MDDIFSLKAAFLQYWLERSWNNVPQSFHDEAEEKCSNEN